PEVHQVRPVAVGADDAHAEAQPDERRGAGDRQPGGQAVRGGLAHAHDGLLLAWVGAQRRTGLSPILHRRTPARRAAGTVRRPPPVQRASIITPCPPVSPPSAWRARPRRSSPSSPAPAPAPAPSTRSAT